MSEVDIIGLVVAPITGEDILKYEAAINARLLEIARRHNIESPVIRDILPGTDLNALSGEIWRQDVSTLGYATNYSGTNPSDAAFIIFGARPLPNGTGRIEAIRFFSGVGQTSIKDVWDIAINAPDRDSISLAEPGSLIEYLPSAGFNIQFYAKLEGIDNVCLLGKVIEPRGKLIAPKGT